MEFQKATNLLSVGSSRALVFLARPLVAVLCFSCAHRHLAPRGGSRGGVRGEAATEVMGDWGATTKRARGAWWRFLLDARAPRRLLGQRAVAAV